MTVSEAVEREELRRSTRARFHTLTVAAVERLSDDAVAVTFDVPEDLRDAYDFDAGQSLTLRRIDRRARSTAAPTRSARRSGRAPRVGVREIPDGMFSHWLVHEVRPGDAVEVQTPTGSFRADPAEGGRHLCIAAGSGHHADAVDRVDACWRTRTPRLTLLYGNRTSGSVMFAEELADLKNRYGSAASSSCTCSRREPRDVELFSGRLDADRLRRLLDGAGAGARRRPRVAVRAVRR